ncbi:MAG: hypothetical protein U9Q15_03855 [Patescibacteria group bacterium]|nr:hypothetical protein [Patescibacteria group bacterium]
MAAASSSITSKALNDSWNPFASSKTEKVTSSTDNNISKSQDTSGDVRDSEQEKFTVVKVAKNTVVEGNTTQYVITDAKSFGEFVKGKNIVGKNQNQKMQTVLKYNGYTLKDGKAYEASGKILQKGSVLTIPYLDTVVHDSSSDIEYTDKCSGETKTLSHYSKVTNTPNSLYFHNENKQVWEVPFYVNKDKKPVITKSVKSNIDGLRANHGLEDWKIAMKQGVIKKTGQKVNMLCLVSPDGKSKKVLGTIVRESCYSTPVVAKSITKVVDKNVIQLEDTKVFPPAQPLASNTTHTTTSKKSPVVIKKAKKQLLSSIQKNISLIEGIDPMEIKQEFLDPEKHKELAQQLDNKTYDYRGWRNVGIASETLSQIPSGLYTPPKHQTVGDNVFSGLTTNVTRQGYVAPQLQTNTSDIFGGTKTIIHASDKKISQQ